MFSGERSVEKNLLSFSSHAAQIPSSNAIVPMKREQVAKRMSAEGEEPFRTRLCGKVFRNPTRSERSCSSEKNERKREGDGDGGVNEWEEPKYTGSLLISSHHQETTGGFCSEPIFL